MTAATATAPAVALGRPAFGSTLAGTGSLLWFMLRRDRMRIFWWTLGVTALYAGGLGEYLLLDDPAASAARSVLISSPAMISMTGPGYGIGDYTPGAAVANEFILWVVLTLAVMSILQIVRHTRSEEESSRSELVRAGTVGRHAPSVAALLLVLIMNVIIAVTSGAAVAAQGFDAGQTFAMTLAIALGALVFGSVALVAAQAYEHGRGAVGLSLAALGAAFLLRALGDVQEEHGSALSWFSPIAWVQQTRVFVDLRWWPLGLCVAAILALIVLAAFLASRRDFGAGLVAVRTGRADAEPTLNGTVALAWVQQRGALLWTALGLGAMWFGSGTIIREVPNMLDAVEGNPVYAALLGSGEDMVRTFLGIFGLYIGAGAAAYGIAAALRAKGEEEAGRTEIVLAAPVSRPRWFASSLVVALLGTAVVQLTGALALWLGAASTGYDEAAFGEYLELGLAYLPALAVLVGLAAALYAWLPRATGVAWVMVGYVFVVGMFADLFDLPGWARRISPFWWVGSPALEDVEASHMWGLSGVAVVLLVIAFAGFRRRDVPSA
jgi:ABC-2 type transport system permease protein